MNECNSEVHSFLLEEILKVPWSYKDTKLLSQSYLEQKLRLETGTLVP